LPAPPTEAAKWGGFYVGLNVGAGSTTGGSSESCLNSLTGDSTGCDIINDSALHGSGILGGGQVGYLRPLDLGWQFPLFLGGELDLQGSGIGGSQTVSGPFNFVGFPGSCSPCNFTANQHIDWLGSVRLRAGVPIDDLLIYVTGGVMFGGVTAAQTVSFLGSDQGEAVTRKGALAGPTVGGGVEFLLSNPWAVKLEALYYDLGDLKTASHPVNGAPANFTDLKTFGFRGAIIRLGVDLHLGDLIF